MSLTISYISQEYITKKSLWIIVSILLIVNFLLRLLIYYNTNLFSFSDYSAYLKGIENIAEGEKVYLLNGNFLFAISYIGYFAKYILGNIDYFFILNCLAGTLATFAIYTLFVKITQSHLGGIIIIILNTFYTEFMVFSSVFYTPVIMIFLLSLFLLFIYYYLKSSTRFKTFINLFLIIIIFLLTFLFKPELKYLPYFILLSGIFLIKRDKKLNRIIILSISLISSYYFLQISGLITHPSENVIANDFVFFGHTDYGGDGGEGSFVYQENKIRYEAALSEYCKTNNITKPTRKDLNAFHWAEIRKFVFQHPLKWIALQLTKFFRTFGVVPEGSSFKILYTGLLKGNLWLTSFIVVIPVVLIILLFIIFFDISVLKKLLFSTGLNSFDSFSQSAHSTKNKLKTINQFNLIYLVIFVYYIIAIIFFGQYQERYRMPVMVVFIIPVLSYSIANFSKNQLMKKTDIFIKSTIIFLFFTVWLFQAKKAISNSDRLNNAIETAIQNSGS